MKSYFPFIAIVCGVGLASPPAISADAAAPVPASASASAPVTLTAPSAPATPAHAAAGPTVVYRQVMPDGRVVYSDKAQKGAKIDHTITIDPPIKGNLWTTESGTKPAIPPQIEETPVNQVSVIPVPGQKKTLADANSDVIRAEMLLEDAKKRQETGVEPLAGERTGNSAGRSRLNEAYAARQKLLARAVVYAEAALKQAIAERDALRHGAR
ncbi:MAG TPA: hypothetical protein DIT28_06655 [Oxalobacteraceae bacterium]|nr:hypothetical protein [Oxalobacteraceae bacterium]